MIKELNENIIGKLAIIRIPFDAMIMNTIVQIVGISTDNFISKGDTFINGEWYNYDVLLKKIDNVNYGEYSYYFHSCTRKFLVKEPLVYSLQLYYYAPHHVLELIDNN